MLPFPGEVWPRSPLSCQQEKSRRHEQLRLGTEVCHMLDSVFINKETKFSVVRDAMGALSKASHKDAPASSPSLAEGASACLTAPSLARRPAPPCRFLVSLKKPWVLWRSFQNQASPAPEVEMAGSAQQHGARLSKSPRHTVGFSCMAWPW